MFSKEIEAWIKRLQAHDDDFLCDLINFKFDGEALVVTCQDEDLADLVWREFTESFLPLRLKVNVGNDIVEICHPPNLLPTKGMTTKNIASTIASHWLQSHSGEAALFQSQGTFSVHLNDRDRGFPCLDLCPMLGNWDHVFSPNPKDFIGKPANFSLGLDGKPVEHLFQMSREEKKSLPSVTGEAKQTAILKAISSENKRGFVDYEFDHLGILWKLRYEATCVNESEILCFGYNLLGHQRGFWQDRAVRLSL